MVHHHPIEWWGSVVTHRDGSFDKGNSNPIAARVVPSYRACKRRPIQGTEPNDDIADVILFEPRVFADERGFFFESFNQRQFEQAVGRPVSFVQDNHSRSAHNVLRGLYYQIKQPQGKLVRAVTGAVFAVAVDI